MGVRVHPGIEETAMGTPVRIGIGILCVVALYYLVVTLARSVPAG